MSVPTITRPLVCKPNVAIFDSPVWCPVLPYFLFQREFLVSLFLRQAAHSIERKIDNIFKMITRIHIYMYMCVYMYIKCTYMCMYMQMYTLHTSSPTYSFMHIQLNFLILNPWWNNFFVLPSLFESTYTKWKYHCARIALIRVDTSFVTYSTYVIKRRI